MSSFYANLIPALKTKIAAQTGDTIYIDAFDIDECLCRASNDPINDNTLLWEFLAKLPKAAAMASASNRQSFNVDYNNSQSKKTQFSPQILARVSEQLAIPLLGFWMADVHGSLPIGTSMDRSMDFYALEAEGKLEEAFEVQHAQYLFDNDKFTWSYAFSHWLAAELCPGKKVVIRMFDDLSGIMEKLNDLYRSKKLLSDACSFQWYQYDGKKSPVLLAEVHGTANTDTDFRATILAIKESIKHPKWKKRFGPENIEEDIGGTLQYLEGSSFFDKLIARRSLGQEGKASPIIPESPAQAKATNTASVLSNSFRSKRSIEKSCDREVRNLFFGNTIKREEGCFDLTLIGNQESSGDDEDSYSSTGTTP